MQLEDYPNIFDFDRIAEMRESLGPVVLAGLLERFLKEGDRLLQKLSNLEIEQELLNDLIKEVHKVTGSAAVLGAIEIHAKLQNVEIEGKSGHSENLWNAVDELRRVWLRAKSSLKERGFVLS